jgi:DNA-binding XRE family transcriptional regulator
MLFAKLSEGLPKKVGRVADVVNEPNFQNLAQAVLVWRMRHGLSQATVAARGGPSDTTLSAIEAMEWNSSRPDQTLAKLDDGLWWPKGTARKVLFEGFDPVEEVLKFEEPAETRRAVRHKFYGGGIPLDDVDLPDDIEELDTLVKELGHQVLVLEAVVAEHQADLARAKVQHDRARAQLHRLQDLGQARERMLLERVEPAAIFDEDESLPTAAHDDPTDPLDEAEQTERST